MALEIEGKIYRVTKNQHVKPGKGGAYVQVRYQSRSCAWSAPAKDALAHVLWWTQCDLKEIKTGNKMSRRFRAAESVAKAPLGPDQFFQFLYQEGSNLVIMHNTSFEQVRPIGPLWQESGGC